MKTELYLLVCLLGASVVNAADLSPRAREIYNMDFSTLFQLRQSCFKPENWKTDDCRALAETSAQANEDARKTWKEQVVAFDLGKCAEGNAARCVTAHCPPDTSAKYIDADLQDCASFLKLPSSQDWAVIKTPEMFRGRYFVICFDKVHYTGDYGEDAAMRWGIAVTQSPNGKFQADSLGRKNFSSLEEAVKAGCPAGVRQARDYLRDHCNKFASMPSAQ